MVFKSNISKYKQKLIIFLSALFIALLLQPKQTVYADAYSDIAKYVIVNSTNSSTQGGTNKITNGVLPTRTGYLCYLLTKDGAAVPGGSAIAFKSPGFANVQSDQSVMWVANARKGGYSVAQWENATAPWGLTPWEGDGSPSNEPGIKNWFLSMDGSGTSKGVAFVEQYWGAEAATHFTNDDYILVIETLMHFQYSVKDTSSVLSLDQMARAMYNITFPTSQDLLHYIESNHRTLGDYYYNAPSSKRGEIIRSFKNNIIENIKIELEAQGFGDNTGGRRFVGPPLIGTVPELLKAKQALGMTTNPFYSYTNASACMNEKIIINEAGFVVCPVNATKSSPLSDDQVFNYGVAMMIIHANSPAQTTCNEPLQPSPHDPPIESTGHTTIVKSYRTKDPTNTLIDDGTYSTSDLGTQILIENEQEYQVVGWKTSTTTNTSISSISWESSVPSSVQQQGTTPTSVTLQPIETCLYVLLEKIESEPPEVEDYNYLMTQSTITRRVWMR